MAAHVSYHQLVDLIHNFAVGKMDESRERFTRYPATALDSVLDDFVADLKSRGIDLKKRFRLTNREFGVLMDNFARRLEAERRSYFRVKLPQNAFEVLMDELEEFLKESLGDQIHS